MFYNPFTNDFSIPDIITEEYLNSHPEYYFVFGDNTIHSGMGGGAILRYHPQAIGFITKKFPNDLRNSFYTPEDYKETFEAELEMLKKKVKDNPKKLFLISKLGGGLANLHKIFEKVIEPSLKETFKDTENVVLMW